MKLSHLTAAIFVVALFGILETEHWYEIDRLHDRARDLEDQLREAELRRALHDLEDQVRDVVEPSVPVGVTCICPDYEEGWDDAEYAGGCDPDMGEMTIEELQTVCTELVSFGYVPHC
jgi:hypothetical protein